MKIQDFRKYCSDETIQVTSHALLRLRERNITIAQIESCIMHGEIIEEYPDDSPFSSALISESRIGKPLHVVAGLGNQEIWITTAYYPDLEKWESDFKTRKESTP